MNTTSRKINCMKVKIWLFVKSSYRISIMPTESNFLKMMYISAKSKVNAVIIVKNDPGDSEANGTPERKSIL